MVFMTGPPLVTQAETIQIAVLTEDSLSVTGLSLMYVKNRKIVNERRSAGKLLCQILIAK